MKLTQIPRRSSRIARCAVKQGARPAMTSQVAVEKLATEIKTTTSSKLSSSKATLLKGKKDVRIATFNIQTLRKEGKIPEVIASAEATQQDVICLQEHRYIHEDLTTKEHSFGNWRLVICSAWKNQVNAATEGTAMLFNQQAYNALASVEMISPRIMIATINGNPQTTIISCYSPTNVSKEDEAEKFYEELTSVTRQVPKHNILIIGGDFNAQLGQSDGFKYAYHTETNRHGSILKDYLNENNLLCLNTKFQKRPGQLWTHKSPTGGKAQLDYIIINQKWKNSVKNCGAYNSFVSVASDHRIVTAKIRLSLRANKKKRNNNIPYDWSTLKDDSDLRNTFIIRVNNRFTALQDKSQTRNADTTYSNFETAIKETAFDTIPLKPKIKKHTPWENREIYEKREQLHKAANVKQSNPSPENIAYYENALSDLKEAYK